MGECPRDEIAIYCFGTLKICKRRFHGKCVLLQPVEEGGLAKEAIIWMLRGMGMRVDEAREIEGVAFKVDWCGIMP